MKRWMAYLAQAVFALVVAGSMSFGVSRAFASERAALKSCPDMGYDYAYSPCASGCPTGRGYCADGGYCQCGDIP